MNNNKRKQISRTTKKQNKNQNKQTNKQKTELSVYLLMFLMSFLIGRMFIFTFFAWNLKIIFAKVENWIVNCLHS